MRITSQTLDFINLFEGLSLNAYEDQKGIWTIGYGSTGPDIYEGLTITQPEALLRMEHDLNLILTRLKHIIIPSLNDNETTAILSLTYNIGINAFLDSKVLKFLNDLNFVTAAEAFLLWNKVHSVINQGLVTRRLKEKQLFLTPCTDKT